MCKVVVNDSNSYVEFIIYNHVFSKKSTFTVLELVQELQVYNLNLSHEYVQAEIDCYVKLGIVNQNLEGYLMCYR